MSRCTRGCTIIWLLTLFTSAISGALDSPDLVWRDWLLVEDMAPSDPVSGGVLLRRITPKSVFVAPNLSGCSEGYRQDAMGRCVKLVKVNQAAQLDFILQKLNSMYAPPPSKKDEKDAPGPFHVSLPLGGAEKQQETKTKTTEPPQTTTLKTDTTTTTGTTLSTTITTTIPTTTSFISTTDHEHETTTDLLNFSDSVTTFRIPHNTEQPPDVDKVGFSKGSNENKPEIYVNNENTDSKRPFVIVVANSTYESSQNSEILPLVVYDTTTTTEYTQESTGTSLGFTGENESFSTNDGATTTVTTENVPPVEFESSRPESFDIYTSTAATGVPTTHTTIIEDIDDIEEQVFGETKGVIRDGQNKAPAANLQENYRPKCDLSVQVSQLRDGRIISQSSKIDCQPETTTTMRIPVRTTTPKQKANIRFPTDTSNVHKTSYIRFPEGSVSSYGTKVWNDDSNSQPFWWPTAWNPFQSSFIRGWPVADRNQASSTVFHKQYHQHSPTWTNKHTQQSWPIRRIYQ